MIGVPGTADRLFGALRGANISVILISQASSEHSICFAVPGDAADQVEIVVREAFAAELDQNQIQRVEIRRNCSIIAVVGDHQHGQILFDKQVADRVSHRQANVRDVTASIRERMSDLDSRFPGVTVVYEGRQAETAESFSSLRVGFPAALLMIYAILATIFRSYMQPLLVMTAIPFALAGAVAGYVIMGYPLGLLSMIGAVALTGIVVNDSLILLDFINARRREGAGLRAALLKAGGQRFRPIVLTSATWRP